ncbi:MAG: hypothetical protein QE271_05150 [Bacteriovoracaceae bacterium]|nr:hypothetical protein [Bacteriovoracaceae bacterium]
MKKTMTKLGILSIIFLMGVVGETLAETFNVKLDFTNVPQAALHREGKVHILAWRRKNFLDDNILEIEGKYISSLSPDSIITMSIELTKEQLNFSEDLAFTVFLDNNGNADFDKKNEIFGCTTTNKRLRDQVNAWNYLFNRGLIFKSCRVKLSDLLVKDAPLSFLLTTLD